MNPHPPSGTDRLKQVRMLLLDVDGVLTDGRIIYDDRGVETKEFNVKDGLGIRMLLTAGIAVGIVTGRSCPALTHRCRNLGIDLVLDGVQNKAETLERILGNHPLAPEEVAFMGDDLPDLPLMRRVGLSIAVADAHPLVAAHAHVVTVAKGGGGAVREISEAILKAQGLWEKALDRF
jgi:3-deoxy-D-manno-octulosonate 8-phosphate phosphatase (KDO 8-P phosphatase)